MRLAAARRAVAQRSEAAATALHAQQSTLHTARPTDRRDHPLPDQAR